MRIRNPGCGSGIFYPGSNKSKKRGGETNFLNLFLFPQILQNWKSFCFWTGTVPYRKKVEPIDKELQYVLPQKLSKLLNICVGDPRSRIRKDRSGSRMPDPGVKKAPDPGPGSATLYYKRFFKLNSGSHLPVPTYFIYWFWFKFILHDQLFFLTCFYYNRSYFKGEIEKV